MLLTSALGTGGFVTWQSMSGKAAEADELPPPVYVEVPPMVVNLDNGGGPARFLKARVMIAARDEAAAEQLRARLPEINDSFIAFFRDVRPVDMVGAQGPFRIKEELLLRATAVARPHKVDDVLIQELVQQ
ncbi:flagellar basal body-associated FliL family protein [Sandaracinobacteroides saxicola]|uniref:Flagellar protein FliL n=1 Tax=Sandaracinobacteroides saxicola TaxID=2759707 RepID=A0A7G5IK18_9SPHN|nr:flagellar basal body-associated FliL family protein [Sandaracinobacteroides saxicola]QMW23710.1 flagellar basal body-associated FliL family protein [Sandaracinobacteroides saxicola]